MVGGGEGGGGRRKGKIDKIVLVHFRVYQSIDVAGAALLRA